MENNNGDLVSIIIPCYNSAKYLSETIESALNQTWGNKEIIIVDDGSTDNSLVIARSFNNAALKVLSQVNKGASAARNKGLQEAKGEYIQFLDADDLLPPEKIEKQMIILRDFPNCITCCSWIKFEDKLNNTKGPIEPQLLNKKDTLPIDWLIKREMMVIHGWLAPRAIINKAGLWREDLSYNDDGEYFCRVVLQSDEIKFCPDCIVYYRNHNGVRLSRGRDNKAAISLLKSYISFEEKLLNAEVSERTKNAIAVNYIQFIYQFHVEYADLVIEAKDRLRKLGVKKIIKKGNFLFYSFNRIFGFNAALLFNAFFRRIKTFYIKKGN